MICHYAAFLRTWAHATPETTVNGRQAEPRLSFGNKMFVALFGCRKRNWSLRDIEVRRGGQTATFTRGELAKAVAALLGHEPLPPTPQAITAASGPRTAPTWLWRRPGSPSGPCARPAAPPARRPPAT